uniref:50S ribosomal protein L13 n=1 Tax=Pyramimonas obovata TaxID=1411642 RepID=A0A7S0WQN1_9CHLO|mmetsp:Transcript_35091/g.76710  ORF Transcript_35091/g.76710 Transcript_35091/m.76710 type:complete len:205 (+) Transcript_35091:171-785(+)|eukprot:CAMPEP_0118942018 /NCGR_PEP_ID=MMETSP1169-20130426/35182_1 /TAXON_ID=36882 /ORGANISM="Pyramimonas obovata, Strain CCMP722" /LENGTH=204 /DNA_ID=CAMNT_0006886937 /DNA_START=170 /DNA_END=784 /DNA_ORIENTATION=-
MSKVPKFRGVNTEGLRFRVIDAQEEVLGRLAAHLSTVLQGKDKPTYAPNVDNGDVVVVVNAEKINLTGNKQTGKFYTWHTGYPGGLKTRSVRDQLERKPEEVLKKAVQRMLPDNKLRTARMRKLRLVVGPDHGFAAEALVPLNMPPRKDSRGTKRELEPGVVPLDPAEWSSFTLPDGKKFGDLTLLLQGDDLPLPDEKVLNGGK